MFAYFSFNEVLNSTSVCMFIFCCNLTIRKLRQNFSGCFGLFLWLNIDMAYLHGIPIWHTYMAYLHGIPTWHAYMIYLNGIILWHTYMAYLYGIPTWHTYLAYLYGIPTWHTYMVYLHGIPTWHTCMAYLYGILTWHTYKAYLNGTPTRVVGKFSHFWAGVLAYLLREGGHEFKSRW